jgi:glutaredoxin-dependent peroxiredoxin
MSLLNQTAPAFKLFNTEKKEINLSDYQGKNVLILFFPLAFTSVCTVELCAVRDNIALYNAVNAEVLGISVDSLFVLDKFKAEQKLNFNLLSDFNKTTSSDYGCIYQDFVLGMKGVSKRSAFVIDKAGIVRYEEVLENAGEQPNFDKIQATLATLA